MRKDFDAEKTKCEVLIDEINGLKKKCLILQDEFQSESKSLDVKKFELESLNTENEGLNQQIVKAQNDFEYINLETMKKLKIENSCEVCVASVSNHSELKEHTRRYHTHCKSTQFEKDLPFEAYPCFYCDEPLNSANEIISHARVCEKVSSDLPNIFQCDKCELFCASMEDLLGHVNDYHPELPEVKEVFSCDICPLRFDTECNLQFHKRGCHWDWDYP